MSHRAVGMLIAAVALIGRKACKHIPQNGIAKELIHLRVEQTAVVIRKGEAVLAAFLGLHTGFLVHHIAHFDDDPLDGVGKPFRQVRLIQDEINQVFLAHEGAGQGHGAADVAHGAGAAACFLKDTLLFLRPVGGQHRGTDVKLVHPIQHRFQFFRCFGAAVQPFRVIDVLIPAAEDFTDTLHIGELHGIEVLRQQSLADDFLRLVVVALVQLRLADGVNRIPGMALHPQLRIDALIAHADAQCCLRRSCREAVILMSQLIVRPELIDVQIKMLHLIHAPCRGSRSRPES